eukprot:TRINITY_DN1236_c0_g1_i1.p1 TRINITY_DN1236_c0_g1~~TRINITY_DN1236_c0_g1_i1.p1  ORF type:complete len:2199 (+),score=638.60 TRINITY_DN1236_c0_g1_i1:411-7007(+)
MSRADCWQLAGTVALEEALPAGVQLDFKFHWGRSDAASCDQEIARLPAAEGGNAHVLGIFHKRMGLTISEVVALNGAHAVGRMDSRFSGYPGVDGVPAAAPWVANPAVFDNGLYASMNASTWEYKTSPNGARNFFYDPTSQRVNLVADMSLMWDLGVGGGETDPAKDPKKCLPVSSAPNRCPLQPLGKGGSRHWVEQFARDRGVFYEHFISGWVKLQNVGETHLQLVCEDTGPCAVQEPACPTKTPVRGLTKADVAEFKQAMVDELIPAGQNIGVLGDRADVVGVYVRLAFHDAGTYDPYAACGARAGPDGCLMLNDGANAGLAAAIDALNPICGRFRRVMSRADCWQLAGTIALEVALPAGVNLDFNFHWGRSSADQCDQEQGRLPSAEGGNSHVLDIFHRRMDLTVGEVVALNGAHAVGRASSSFSGYPSATGLGHAAPWTANPAVFDNGLYSTMNNTAWEPKTSDDGARNFFVDPSTGRINLVTDLSLLWDFGTGGGETDPAKDPKRCYPRGGSAPSSLPACLLQTGRTREWVELFAADRDAFYVQFINGWVKMQNLGHQGLHKVCDDSADCPDPVDPTPCTEGGRLPTRGMTKADVRGFKIALQQEVFPTGSNRGPLGDRADTFGVLGRLGFHDAGTYDPDAACGQRGGPDGCLMLTDSANAGLAAAIDVLNPICYRFSAWMSRADCWQLAGTLAFEEALPAGVEVDFNFHFGRSDADVCTFEEGRLPSAEGGNAHVLGIFHHRIGLTVAEVVALNGAHAVGRTETNFSGYPGRSDLEVAPWTARPAIFDNGLYSTMNGTRWEYKTSDDGVRNFFVDATSNRINLVTDLSMLYDFGVGGAETDPAKDPKQCLPHDGSVQSTGPRCQFQTSGTKEWVDLYARDRDAFYRDFVSAWGKLAGAGYTNLQPVCDTQESCDLPVPAAPCTDSPQPSRGLSKSHVRQFKREVVRQLIPAGMGSSPLGDRADAIGVLVRLAFHDAGTYDPDVPCEQRGGPDGCLLLTDSANNGLADAIAVLNPICDKFAAVMSRADCWQLAGTVALEEGLPAGVSVDFDFHYGRRDAASCSHEVARLPSAEGGNAHVLGIFHHRMGLTVGEVVALNGAHAVGRSDSRFSGYPGRASTPQAPWTSNPAVFDNGLYARMNDTAWELTKSDDGARNFFFDPATGRMNLISDLSLLFDLGVGGAETDPTKDPKQCLPHGGSFTSPGPRCMLQTGETREWVELFARDRDAFYREYVSGWVKLQGVGHSNLLPVCEDGTPCPAPTPIGCGSTPAPAGPAPVACTPSTLSLTADGTETFQCMLQITGLSGMELHWTALNGQVAYGARSTSTGWLGVSFAQQFRRMSPARAILGWGTQTGSYRIEDRSATMTGDVAAELGLTGVSSEEVNGQTILRFTVATCATGANTGDGCVNIDGDVNMNVAYHPTAKDDSSPHPLGSQSARSVALNIATGGGTSFESASVHKTERRLHGKLMIVAWIYLAPLSIFLRRYGKPIFAVGMSAQLSIRLFGFHIVPSLTAVGISLASFGIAFQNWWTWGKKGYAHSGHSEVGHVFFVLMLCQPLIGVLGVLLTPTYDHPQRWIFKAAHSLCGWALVVLGTVQCFLGYKNLRDLDDYDLDVPLTAGVVGFTMLFLMAELLKQKYQVRYRKPGEVDLDGFDERVRRLTNAAQVAEHSIEEDAWVIIDDKAYDVTDWLPEHPGGFTMIMEFAGGDATQGFNSFKHSDTARGILKTYYVADVEAQRVVKSVELAEKVTSALVLLELQEASTLVKAAVRDDLPKELCTSFSRLISNLTAYKPYLPPSLLAEEDEDDEHSSLASSRADQNVQAVRMSLRGSFSTTPRRSVASVSMTGAQHRERDKKLDDRVALILKNKHVSLFMANVKDFLKYAPASEPSRVSSKLGEYLQFCVEECGKQKGVADGFLGDRVTITFNAVVTCTQHKVMASLLSIRVRSMSGESGSPMLKSPLGKHLSISLNIAIGSGSALCGNVGCSGMRRFSVLGKLYGWTCLLERLGSKWPVATLCDESCQEDCKQVFDTRLISRVHSPKHDITSKVFSILTHFQVSEDEWMYQLEEAGNQSRWRVYNAAMQQYLDGKFQDALTAIEEGLDGCAEQPEVVQAMNMLSADIQAVHGDELASEEPRPLAPLHMHEFVVAAAGDTGKNKIPPHIADLLLTSGQMPPPVSFPTDGPSPSAVIEPPTE